MGWGMMECDAVGKVEEGGFLWAIYCIITAGTCFHLHHSGDMYHTSEYRYRSIGLEHLVYLVVLGTHTSLSYLPGQLDLAIRVVSPNIQYVGKYCTPGVNIPVQKRMCFLGKRGVGQVNPCPNIGIVN